MSDVLVVSGLSYGIRIKWFGNTVNIMGVKCTLYRVTYSDGSRQSFYAEKLGALDDVLDLSDVRNIEVKR